MLKIRLYCNYIELITMRIHLTLGIALLMFTSCDDSASKRHLLRIDKDWNDRTETEKLIGCWCQDGGNHTSRRGLEIDFTYKYCYYSDGTMDKYLVTESYVNSTELVSSGKNVTVSNNKLTYYDSESGTKNEYSVTIERNSLQIGRSEYIRCY